MPASLPVRARRLTVTALLLALGAITARAQGRGAQVATKTGPGKPTAVIGGPTPNGGSVHGSAARVEFDARTSYSSPRGRPLTYLWRFGDDGTTSTAGDVFHVFTKPGHHAVTLFVADSGLQSDPYTITWIVPPAAPTAVIDPAGTSTVAFVGKPVAFSAARSTSNPAGHALVATWQFPDGNGGTGVTMLHTFRAVGTYVVTLTVMDEGVFSAPVTATVSVKLDVPAAGDATAPKAATATQAAAAAPRGAPTAVIKSASGVLVDSLMIFDGSASATVPAGRALTYQWDFGDGTTGVGATVTHRYTKQNMYTVSLVVADGATKSAPATTLIRAVVPAKRP